MEYIDPESNSTFNIGRTINPNNADPANMVVISGDLQGYLSKESLKALKNSMPIAMLPLITSTLVAGVRYFFAGRVVSHLESVAKSLYTALDQQRVDSENKIPTPETSPKIGSKKKELFLNSKRDECCAIS